MPSQHGFESNGWVFGIQPANGAEGSWDVTIEEVREVLERAFDNLVIKVDGIVFEVTTVDTGNVDRFEY